MRAIVAAAFGLSLALAGDAARAQTTQTPPLPPSGSTGSTIGGGPADKADSVTAVGQTKPPGSAAPGTNSELDQKSRDLDRKINKGICVGCK